MFMFILHYITVYKWWYVLCIYDILNKSKTAYTFLWCCGVILLKHLLFLSEADDFIQVDLFLAAYNWEILHCYHSYN